MARRALTAVCVLSLLASGCAEMTHLTRTRDMGDSRFLLIDAKQRAISSHDNVNCAEPSPDALSAIAASQGLNVSTPQGTSVGQSLAIAEAVGSIGLRTQSIQLLRDHMFRVCESYQAGKISPFMVALFHRRFQTSTIAILAIEQLTGTVRAPAIVLGGSSATGDADAILKLTASREGVTPTVAAAEKDVTTKTAAATAADADAAAKEAALASASGDAAIAAAKAARDAAKTAAQSANAAKLEAEGVLANRKAALAAIDRALTLAQASGNATAAGTIETGTGRDPGDLAEVAKAVANIVQGTYELGNTRDFCTVLLADAAQADTKIATDGPIVKSCLTLLGTGQMVR